MPDEGHAPAGSRQRVLVLHPSDELYGADRVLLEALAALPDAVEFEVWIPDDLDYPERRLSSILLARGVRVRRMPLPVLRRAYLKPSFVRLHLRRMTATSRAMRAFDPDLVYVNTAALALTLPLSRLLKTRTLLHLHEYAQGRERVVLGRLFAFADRIITVSQAIQGNLSPTLRMRSTVIYNGFDHAEPIAAPCTEKLVFVLASRWNTWKGHEHFLEVWSRLQRTDIELLVLGGPPPSGESTDVLGLVSRMRNAGTVTVIGERDDVRSVIDTAHVVVVPSVKPDPLPTIALEAAGAGRAALVSDSGGLPEIVLDRVTGRTVAPGDVEAWVDIIETLDRQTVDRYGAAARARYESVFSRQRFAECISEEFRKALS